MTENTLASDILAADLAESLGMERGSSVRNNNRKYRKNRRRYEAPMDDIELFKPETVARNEVVLGCYGTAEWLYADMLRARFLAGKQTLEKQHTWLTPSGFSLADWAVAQKFPSYTFFDGSRIVIPTADGYVSINASKGTIHGSLTGDEAFVQDWMDRLDASFARAENLIQWVYNARGDEIQVPLNYRPCINAAYPWIKKPVLDYIDDYLNSEASVLILIGPPGTGKTTFIKSLVHRSGGNAKVAYDEKVLSGDDFFAGFIGGECDILVMEDADAFLSSRQDGNTMMHKFLNVSDGLISAQAKKMIFSTNLDNLADIDPALLRTGRCHDVLHFRPLDRVEAQAVLDEAGNPKTLPDGAKLTLAEIFTTQPTSGDQQRRKVGF